MQCACQQYAACTAVNDCVNIFLAAYPSCSKDLTPLATSDHRRQTIQVRSETGTDPRKSHRNDLCRPESGTIVQKMRPDKTVGPKIEGEYRIGLCCQQIGTGFLTIKNLTADHNGSQISCHPSQQRLSVGDTGVDPEYKILKSASYRKNGVKIVALAENGIEIRNVETPEIMQRKQGRDDLDRYAAFAQRGVDGAVLGAIPMPSMDNHASLKINDRNQLKGQGRARRRIFVYEHITGGGLVNEKLPPSLANEGDLMVQALLDDLASIPDVEVIVTRDARLEPLTGSSRVITIEPGAYLDDILGRGFSEANAVWPIVPETGGLLAMVSERIESAGLDLLGCSTASIRVASSKHATALALAAAGIPTVPTFSDPRQIPEDFSRLVIKPDDGAGCLETRLLSRETALAWWLSSSATKTYVAQPYVVGRSISLSLLCANGEGGVLCCNLQHIARNLEMLEFRGITVNCKAIDRTLYSRLASSIARAIPGLWGYVGIDLLETSDGPMVVDINPRLTTAYAGIKDAFGMNIAEAVLSLNKTLLAREWPDGREVEIRTHHE